MSTMPRNPIWFPKMKVRGKRRRQIEPLHRAAYSFRMVAVSARRASAGINSMVGAINRRWGKP